MGTVIRKRIFRPGIVTRPDAGGRLWAPVDQHGYESGVTPSYNAEAIDAECVRLNQRNASGSVGAQGAKK
jgi:hypothetical protein